MEADDPGEDTDYKVSSGGTREVKLPPELKEKFEREKQAREAANAPAKPPQSKPPR